MLQFQRSERKGAVVQWKPIEQTEAKAYLENRFTAIHTDFLFRQLERGRVVDLANNPDGDIGVKIRAIVPGI